MRFVLAATILVLAAGCGGAKTKTAEFDPVEDALDNVNECLREALESARALTAPPPPDSEDEPPMVGPLPAAVHALVVAAQDLATAAAGKPSEGEAKKLLATAEELEGKAKSGAAPAVVQQGLEQLRTTVAELRRKP